MSVLPSSKNIDDLSHLVFHNSIRVATFNVDNADVRQSLLAHRISQTMLKVEKRSAWTPQPKFSALPFSLSFPPPMLDLKSPIGGATFPSFSLPLSLPFPSLPLQVGPLNTARVVGERCKLPQPGLGQSPSGNRIWCILKSGIWWHQFY